jgi:hypothetical protein
MSSVQTARDLVAHQDYAVTGGNGATALTRKSCEHQEWVFGATGGHEFMIKFDKNFFKKHLLTYSKKSVEVGNRAKELWEAAGQPPGRDVEFWGPGRDGEAVRQAHQIDQCPDRGQGMQATARSSSTYTSAAHAATA